MVKNYLLSFLLLNIFLCNAQKDKLLTSDNEANRSIPPPIYYDYGDAPDTYLTEKESGGPIHSRLYGMPEVYIGASIDYEILAVPGVHANGDDLEGMDEDAVSQTDLEGITTITDNVSLKVTYVNNSEQVVHAFAWIDFDRSGTFDTYEFTSSLNLPPGEGEFDLKWSNLQLSMDISAGISYTRIRIGSQELSSSDVGGDTLLGEVEDHVLNIEEASTLSLDDLEISKEIRIFPNPVVSILQIESSLVIKSISIYSVVGQKIRDFESDTDQIDLNELPSGLYVLKLTTEKGVIIKKIFKGFSSL